MEKQRLIFPSRIFIFRRKNLSVARGLPVHVFLLLQHDAKRVALARVSVEIEVVAENLRQTQRQFRRLPGVRYCIKKRIIHAAHHRHHFRFRRNFTDPCREPALFGDDLQHTVRINLVIDFPQRPFHRPPHRDGVPGAKLPQVERALRRRRGAGGFLRAQPKFLERGHEILARRNFLIVRQDDLVPNAFRFFLRESHLAVVFIPGRQPSLEDKPQSDRARKAFT